MRQDILFVAALDVLVFHGLARLGIHPSDVEAAILKATIEVLDETHDPGHLDAAFDCEFATSLHLPAGTRASPRSNLSETGNDDNLVQIEHATKLRKFLKGLGALQSGEVEAEVGAGLNIDRGEQLLRFDTVNDLVIRSVVPGDGAANIGSLVQLRANLASDVGKVRKAIHSTVQIGPDWFNLGDGEKERVHKAENVECHLLGRESAHAEFLKAFSHNVGRAHQPGAASPSVEQSTNK